MAARVLEAALADMHAILPPPAVQASFDLGFSLLQELVDALHRLTTGPAPVTTAGDPPAPENGDVIDLLTALAHAHIGLERCAINPLA